MAIGILALYLTETYLQISRRVNSSSEIRDSMSDEITKQAAEEFLAAKLAEEGQGQEEKLNSAAAITHAPAVWKSVRDCLVAKCEEWNKVTGEQTLSWRETVLGDIRVWCPERSLNMTMNYDSRRLLVTIKNAGRLENETDVILRIVGYATPEGREAHLVRNDQPVNIDTLLVGELRVLAGIGRRASS